MKNASPRSICMVLTSPFALNAFLLGHLCTLAEDYRITVCVNTMESPVSPQLDSRIELLHIPITRSINLWADIRALLQLVRLFRQKRFDAVHSLTPKGGLLGMLAARICAIPTRTHTFTGQVWATHSGVSRMLLMNMDRLLAVCATDLYADSASQAYFLEQSRICAKGRIQVFGEGSVSGVNLTRFSPIPERRLRIRQQLGIASETPVFLFLGRLQRDKGVLVLAAAFAQIMDRHATPQLLLVGPDEEALGSQIAQQLPGRCHIIGLTSHPEDYIDAADVLCLPSFREGFGSVVIEAAAMGVPTVASRIYGLTDAVVDEETGLLCPPGDPNALANALERMLDISLCKKLALRARERAHSLFGAETISGYWLTYYKKKLNR